MQYAIDSGRGNFFFYKNSLAQRITFQGNKTTGVVVSENSTSFTLIAKKEVILAAGALQSPQLLMVSGVRPKGMINQYGIKVVKNLPGVGQNMQVDLFFSMVYEAGVTTLSQNFGDAQPFYSAIYTSITCLLEHHSNLLPTWRRRDPR